MAGLVGTAFLAWSLGACGTGLAPRETSVKPPTRAVGAPTATPTPPGTWKTVLWGTVFDGSSGQDKPIAGARVSYDHFSSLGGGTGWALTDEQGRYEFALLVHDTDALDLEVQADGFGPYSRRFTGVELRPPVRGRRVNVGLSPVAAETGSP